VNVVILNTNYGAATDENGNYKIADLSSGIYTIEFSAVGFERLRKDELLSEMNQLSLILY
jgi:hypothetical protein